MKEYERYFNTKGIQKDIQKEYQVNLRFFRIFIIMQESTQTLRGLKMTQS